MFFFFQAEDGIRDIGVTGVQTCALPICAGLPRARQAEVLTHAGQREADGEQLERVGGPRDAAGQQQAALERTEPDPVDGFLRSEERRVGKESRSRWSPYH